MAALIFTLMPAFFGGELQAFARGFPLCILCSDDKKMPYGAALADKLSKSLSVKAVLGPRALCNRKANVTLYQHFQGIGFQNPLRPILHYRGTMEPYQQSFPGSSGWWSQHVITHRGLGRIPPHPTPRLLYSNHGTRKNTYPCRTRHKLEWLRPTLSQNDFYLRSV